jgi:hypothetical protein
MATATDFIKDSAVECGVVEGVEYFVVPGPMYGFGGYNGYVRFAEKPVKEPDYGGILAYVPVHGGITYASHDEHGSTYGFDTAHCDSGQFPRHDAEWIREQCAVMARGIRLAAQLEDDYLLAEGDNQKRGAICDQVSALQPGQKMNMGVMLNLMGGRL